MSIQIDKNKCVSCGKCYDICPGNLIERDGDGKALIKYPEECWGCTACLKECQKAAIRYYLGADIGGKGGYLSTRSQKDYIDWHIVCPDSTEYYIRISKKESNKY